MTTTTLLIAGRYRLDHRIAAGAVGEVWRGADLALARPVAVKLLRAQHAAHEEIAARFRAEARHAGSLSHPGIARIYDYCEDDPRHPQYLVMELVDGPSLAALLARGPLNPAQAMNVVAQVADGLAAAHAAGLVHRDIKPANLLLSMDGRVKITDFGISRAAGSAPVTSTGMLVGTPAYLAPERVVGASGAPAADLYALGVVGYECMAGRPPFSGSPLEVAAAHRERPLPPLPASVPRQAAALIAWLTTKDPASRPASARKVAACASRLMAEMADGGTAASLATAPAPGRPGPPPPWPSPGLPPPGPAGPASATLHDSPAPTAWRPRRRAGLGGIAAVAVAVALTAGLAGWLLAGVFARSADRRPVARPATPAWAAFQKIRVDGAALTGRPVHEVRDHLRRLGLLVHVRWRRDDRQPPGTVLSVLPTGNVRAGSLILLTGAAPQHRAVPGHRHELPPPPGRGRGHGRGHGSPHS